MKMPGVLVSEEGTCIDFSNGVMEGNFKMMRSGIEVKLTYFPPAHETALKKYLKGFGAAIITVGIFSIVFSSILLSLNVVLNTDRASSGVWLCLFLITTGFCTLNLLWNANAHTIIAAIIMAVLSIVLTLIPTGMVTAYVVLLIKYQHVVANYTATYANMSRNATTTVIGLWTAEGVQGCLFVVEFVLSVCCLAVAARYLRLKQKVKVCLPITEDNETNTAIKNLPSNLHSENGRIIFRGLTGRSNWCAFGSSLIPYPFPSILHVITLKWIGLGQIAVGLASVTVGSILTTQKVYGDTYTGIWCGAIITINGLMTFVAASSRSSNENQGLMIISWFSMVIAWYLTITGVYFVIAIEHGDVTAMLSGLLLVFGIAESIMSPWGGIIFCKTVGCCCRRKAELYLEVDQDFSVRRATFNEIVKRKIKVYV